MQVLHGSQLLVWLKISRRKAAPTLGRVSIKLGRDRLGVGGLDFRFPTHHRLGQLRGGGGKGAAERHLRLGLLLSSVQREIEHARRFDVKGGMRMLHFVPFCRRLHRRRQAVQPASELAAIVDPDIVRSGVVATRLNRGTQVLLPLAMTADRDGDLVEDFLGHDGEEGVKPFSFLGVRTGARAG